MSIKKIIILCLIVFPVVMGYADKVLFQFEKNEQKPMAESLAQKYLIYSEIKPEFYLLNDSIECKNKNNYDKYFRIQTLNESLKVTYQAKDESVTKSTIIEKGADPIKSSEEFMCQVFNKKASTEKKKLVFLHQLTINIDFLEIMIFNHIKKNINSKVILSEKIIKREQELTNDKEIINKDIGLMIDIVMIEKSFKIQAKIIDFQFKDNNSEFYEEVIINDNIEDKITKLVHKISEAIENKYLPEKKIVHIEWNRVEKESKTEINLNKYQTIDEEIYKKKPSYFDSGKKFSIYAGGVWNAPKKYKLLPEIIEQEFNSSYGFSLMGLANLYKYIIFSVKFNYFPFKKGISIIDDYGINYGQTEVSHVFEIFAGVNGYLELKRLKYGITLQPGMNFSRIAITPSDPSLWEGKDIKGRYFSGFKFQGGLFIESNYLLPCYFEFLYQMGETENLKQAGFAANFMVKIISF